VMGTVISTVKGVKWKKSRAAVEIQREKAEDAGSLLRRLWLGRCGGNLGGKDKKPSWCDSRREGFHLRPYTTCPT
jgi:hypothetical protein